MNYPNHNTSENTSPLWSGEHLEKHATELSNAKFRFVCACYHAMLSEGLTWEEIVFPLTGHSWTHPEVEKAFQNLYIAIQTHGMPDIKGKFLHDSELYGRDDKLS